ncbi:hypothetical protein Poli38472_005992 [Pythium oligandrum]|uniref:Secreted protein n=1 Tax=Pythium oligandrum TaxID=41045 RepID=A0A8K1CSP6_PYTOL|nr:hypothetical protein Poli38472_005992 [Pythium oligandrum]|eukprot:TMW68524.1 hypothetical protein Poli38472_005992 [Pythium oligandrum]
MMTARVLLMLLAVTTVAAYEYVPTPLCSPEQAEAFKAVQQQQPDKCVLQSLHFEVCDDDCLAYNERVAAAAPNCSIGGGDPETEAATYLLKQCKNYHLTTFNKYMPKESPGLRNCTSTEQIEWDKTTAPFTPIALCVPTTIGGKPYCSADCLKVIEDTITKAPQCAMRGAFAAGEAIKDLLVACIKAIDYNLEGNKVLQTVVPGNSDSESAAPRVPVAAVATTIVLGLVAAGLV